jgi:hypothetical protein
MAHGRSQTWVSENAGNAVSESGRVPLVDQVSGPPVIDQRGQATDG